MKIRKPKLYFDTSKWYILEIERYVFPTVILKVVGNNENGDDKLTLVSLTFAWWKWWVKVKWWIGKREGN